MIPFANVEAARAGQFFTVCGRPATILPDFDVESFSMAGYVWRRDEHSDDPLAGKWDAPEGIDAKNKGLSCVGTVNYAAHPSFELLCLAYDLKDGTGRHRWRKGDAPPAALIQHIAAGGIIEAHNAQFERRAWNAHALKHWGATPIRIQQQRCSLAKARASGWPPGLGKAAAALGTIHKQETGRALINMFCMPVKPTKKHPKIRVMPEDQPVKFDELCDYNEGDIVAEAHLSANVPDLSPQEQEYWFIDQIVNERGVAVDTVSLDAAARILAQADALYVTEFRSLTGGLNPTQRDKFIGWCKAQGVHLDNLQEETVAATLADGHTLPPLVRRTLEIRAALGSASVKKVHAMRAMVTPAGRLHDLFLFHAAHTGRPTGSGPQPTNLPKAGPNVWRCACGKFYGESCGFCAWCGAGPEARRTRRKNVMTGKYEWQPLLPGDKSLEWNPDAMKDAIQVIRAGSLALLELHFGEALTTIGGCLRGFFVAGEGYDLVSSDWTAIEAVVLACLSGEQWRIDLFREGGKIYEKSGALVHGLQYDDVIAYAVANGHHHPARQTGKTAELGLGYRGWIPAWRNFEDEKAPLTDDEISEIILKWRDASPMIVEFWGGQSRGRGYQRRWERFGVEGAFIDAALQPGVDFKFRGLKFTGHETVNYETGEITKTVVITLLSGRTITYNHVKLHRSERKGNEYDIQYWRWNTNPKNGPPNQWIPVWTHGGKLTENIVQATANDILRAAKVECERRGYRIVLHVYDELVAEVRPDFGSVEELEEIMARQLHWAYTLDGQPWPIKAAGGWRDLRYRKG